MSSVLEELAKIFQTLEKKSPEDRIRALLGLRSDGDERFHSQWFSTVQLHSIQDLSPHKKLVTFSSKVERYYCNFMGNLHGGAQATFFDIATSIALQGFAKKDSWLNGGVSRDLSVTYIRPAPEGSELLMECEIMHMGQNLALTRAILRRAEDGAIISVCEHNKAAIQTGSKL